MSVLSLQGDNVGHLPAISGQPFEAMQTLLEPAQQVPFIGGPFIGGPFIGGPFIGGPFIGGPFIGGPFIGGPFIGGPFIGGPFIGGPFIGGQRLDSVFPVFVDGQKSAIDDTATTIC